ncbi:methylase [Gammaproteobacteria bacterium 54_18_T64]|nr:methylase [Gammaproteobacteria bacterium 54_18_T64]
MLDKPFSQACENNQQAIFTVLERVFTQAQEVLEIGSGTGQHASYFAPRLPQLVWQTSDQADYHPGINAWIADTNAENLRRPLLLNVDMPEWPIAGVDAVFSANTCHIMGWASVVNMFTHLADVLALGGTLAIYGPFNYDGQYTSPSNANFDQWLKQRGAHQGIRDFEAVDQLASRAGMSLLEDNAMPANNRLLVWRKN